MKKLIINICMVFILFSCSKKTQTNDITNANIPTVRLVTEKLGLKDKSFNAMAWNGIMRFYGDSLDNPSLLDKKYTSVSCNQASDYGSTLAVAANSGLDLVCAVGFAFADPMAKIAQQYPEQKFMIADAPWLSLNNVMQFSFREHEGAYIVGLIAALKAKEDKIENPKFGFVGGVKSKVITKFEIGYVQGIKSVYPNAKIVDYYANDWNKPQLAKIQAKFLFDKGVYAIFSAAGKTGMGVIEQAKYYRSIGKNVWAIGVDADQYADGLYSNNKSAVLTSMIKRVDIATESALKAVQNGTFSGKKFELGIKENGVEASLKNTSAFSKNMLTQIVKAKNEIVYGKIKVYKTYSKALEVGIAPKGLGAIDID